MRYSIEGRSTGQGACTTMGCERLNVSRTGNHWEESRDMSMGENFWVVDISGTGKHRCRWMEMTSEGAIIQQAPDGYPDYWPGGECPVCNQSQEP